MCSWVSTRIKRIEWVHSNDGHANIPHEGWSIRFPIQRCRPPQPLHWIAKETQRIQLPSVVFHSRFVHSNRSNVDTNNIGVALRSAKLSRLSGSTASQLYEDPQFALSKHYASSDEQALIKEATLVESNSAERWKDYEGNGRSGTIWRDLLLRCLLVRVSWWSRRHCMLLYCCCCCLYITEQTRAHRPDGGRLKCVGRENNTLS